MSWTIDASSPSTTIQPVPGVRYVKRWVTHIHMSEQTLVPTLVLQQQYACMEQDPATGKSRCFVEWRDVPTEDEKA